MINLSKLMKQNKYEQITLIITCNEYAVEKTFFGAVKRGGQRLFSAPNEKTLAGCIQVLDEQAKKYLDQFGEES